MYATAEVGTEEDTGDDDDIELWYKAGGAGFASSSFRYCLADGVHCAESIALGDAIEGPGLLEVVLAISWCMSARSPSLSLNAFTSSRAGSGLRIRLRDCFFASIESIPMCNDEGNVYSR